MHSNLTTDVTILRNNLARANPDRENVILVKTGSLNPIHRGHISNMIKTKKYLEEVYGFNVIGGYISPTHDQYVRGKLAHQCIPGVHRIVMCQKAIEEEQQQHWLSVDKAECMAPKFISLNNVSTSLKSFINEILSLPKPVQVIYVAGLDLFNRCHGMDRLRSKDRDGVAVLYRSGEEERDVAFLLSLNGSKIYYIKDDNPVSGVAASVLNDISSTKIREKFYDRQYCEQLTYRSVLDYAQQISSTPMNTE